MNVLLAAHQGDIDTVRQLLSAGEDVDARDGDGITPLHVMIMVVRDKERREELYELFQKHAGTETP